MPPPHAIAEKGAGQWEVALPPAPYDEALQALLDLKESLQADFSALPQAGQPGSGLHVHVHLQDAQGHNVFYKKDEMMSEPLAHSIAGMLALLPSQLDVFAPNPQARARLRGAGTAPNTISWGANNRTCALRLPDIGAPYRHIEHRVASADADPQAVFDAILQAMHHGLTKKLKPPPQIYGDANLPQYALQKLVV